MQLTLLNTPNQDLPFVNGDRTFVLGLRTYDSKVYASISVNGDVVVAGHRVIPNANLFCHDFLAEAYGTLAFSNRYDADVNDYTQFNKGVVLEYTSES